MSKVKKEHLDKIKEQQENLQKLVGNIGAIESQKHAMLHELAIINAEVEDFKKELEKEYGKININLEDGSYTEIEAEELEVENV